MITGGRRPVSKARPVALALLAGAALIGAAPCAWAQSRHDPVESSALALAAYEASKEQCIYSEGLGRALRAIDAYLARTQGSTPRSSVASVTRSPTGSAQCPSVGGSLQRE